MGGDTGGESSGGENHDDLAPWVEFLRACEALGESGGIAPPAAKAPLSPCGAAGAGTRPLIAFALPASASNDLRTGVK